MTDPETLLTALKNAKATAFDGYINDPDDENHLRYQSLHELEAVFEDMIAAAPAVQSLANQVHVPLALLESWIHAIARNRLYPDDSSFIQAEDAIRAAAATLLTPEEIDQAKTPLRPPRHYGAELDPNDAALPLLRDPTEDSLREQNDWLKNVGKAAVREAWRQDTPPLTVEQRSRPKTGVGDEKRLVKIKRFG